MTFAAVLRAGAWLFALACVTGARPVAAVENPVLPPCETIGVALVDTVDSARAVAGDRFRFQTLVDIPAAPSHPALPKNTIGYGLVMGAHHGQRGGRPGHILVDARFFELADGTRVDATWIPRSRYDAQVMDGSSADAPGYIGMIPFASVMTGAYNTLHYGHEVVFNAGTHFSVLVGDDLELGRCRLVVEPAPTPKPSATPVPGASALPSPATSASPALPSASLPPVTQSASPPAPATPSAKPSPPPR